MILDNKQKIMIKHYGRYGFPSDPIGDYSIRLIYVALELCEITYNDVYTFSWIIGIPCVISCMNALFDKRNDKSIYWVNFRPKVTPVILHIFANFPVLCLDMPSECKLA